MRSSRIIRGEANKDGLSGQLTIYIGLFNAATYLSSLEVQLRSQDDRYKIIVVDNHSLDSTWLEVQNWLEIFAGRITLVRNPLNLGGSGSLYLNADLITTPWFATLHQDDFYLSSHVSSLAEAISVSGPDAICITTEMGSLSSEGERQGAPPRASWFLPDTEPATIFLSNLRLHNVPYPSAAFRVDKFLEYAVPWESTAFPDTEWVLKVASVGEFVFVNQETMLYRENPNSESHSITSAEKSLGASMALLRVLGADTFHDLCLSLSEQNRTRFAEALVSGLDIRLAGSSLLDDVKLFALQRMAFAWEYGEGFTNNQLSAKYSSLGANFSTNLLKSLDVFNGRDILHAAETPLDGEINSSPAVRSRGLKRALLKGTLNAYGKLPITLRRALGRLSGVVLGLLKSDSPWNFRWK